MIVSMKMKRKSSKKIRILGVTILSLHRSAEEWICAYAHTLVKTDLCLLKDTVSLKFNCPLKDKQREHGVGDAS